MSKLEERRSHYSRLLEAHGQAHLLTHWAELDNAQREQLLDDLDQIDIPACQLLIDSHVRNVPTIALPERIEPARIFPTQADQNLAELYRRALETGQAATKEGKVAAFTVAGGQGTRLGYDGPKGAFEISPIRSASLFQLFAESLLGTERRYGRRPRWYIMTSPSNHADTLAFFENNAFFGLSPAEVRFFPQGQMPAFLPDGKIAMAERHRIALSPDGHGGSLRALATSGALADMREHGVEYISYFQVDNPLVRTIDPLFVGLHILQESEMSSKAVTKANDLERVGNFCLADGKLTVIEYSDLPDRLATERTPDGARRFDAGSIAIHVISRTFVERLTAEDAAIKLPWHRADKKLKVLDAAGRAVTPDSPNVVKVEMFVFDAIPLARSPLVLYTPREEEFSPVKNAEGVDSAVTARRDLQRRAARWLEGCGCSIPLDAAGEPDLPLEISPVFALDTEDLAAQLTASPEAARGQPLLLE